MDQFAEELSSSLDSGGRPARGAAPTIVIGLGAFGSACLNCLHQNFEVLPDRMSALAMRGEPDLVAGISWLTEGAVDTALTPGAGVTRASVFNDFLEHRDSFETWLKKTAAGLLAKPDRGLQTGRIRVFMIARAEETDASALAVAGADVIKAALSGYISNWNITLQGFILLPKGRCRHGAQVYALLNELKTGEYGYDQVFFVSEGNAGGLIDQEGSADLISEFVGLMLEPDFAVAVADILHVTRADSASFGLTSVVHPVKRLIADESARFSRELINTGLLSAGDAPFYRLADEYIKSERLTVDALFGKLTTDTDGVVMDKIDIDSLMLTNVPMGFWPDRIASYSGFLGRERVPGLINKVEINLAGLSAEIGAGLRAKVDELMSEPLALEKTREFIVRLSEKADELKANAERARQEVTSRVPDLAAYHDALVERIQNLPSLSAVAGRTFLMTTLIFFFTLRFIDILRGLPDQYFDPRYLPPPVPAAVLACLITVISAWLIYRRAEHGLFQTREAYQHAVGVKYRLALKHHAFQVLSWWLGGSGLDELAERGLTSFKSIVANEQAAVVRINRLYLQINDQLKAETVDIGDNRVRRSVFSAFGQEADLRYKKGRYNLADETEQFTVFGHTGWRSLELTELHGRLTEFCRRGLDFIDNRSLDSLFVDFSGKRHVSTGVIEEMRRAAQPYIAVAGGLPHVIELVGVAGGSQSALATQVSWAGQASIVPILSPHRLSFVQIVSPVVVKRLAAYPQWRRAYEAAPNRREIDCKTGDGGRGTGDGEEAA